MNIGWERGCRLLALKFYKLNLKNYHFAFMKQQQQKQQRTTVSFIRYIWNNYDNNIYGRNSHINFSNNKHNNLQQNQRYSDVSSKSAATTGDESKINKKNVNDNRIPSTPNPDEQSEKRTMPRLMNFPEVMWPSMINTIRNWILIQFIIRPYFDNDFYLKDFVFGAKKAMQVVSSKLMNGDFTSLNNMITSEAANELKPVIQKLSVSQRRQLEVKDSDIYLSFPYQVGVMFGDNNDRQSQKRWVEITMVFHVLKGLKELRESGDEIPWNMGSMPEYQDKMFVCNYRFIKEFTSGHESDWIINVVNHFKPIDLINEMKN